MSEIRIRQLHYVKGTTITNNNKSFHQIVDHKLGRKNIVVSKSQNDIQSISYNPQVYFENFTQNSNSDREQSNLKGFRYTFSVENHENQNVQTHFLQAFTHSIVFIQVQDTMTRLILRKIVIGYRLQMTIANKLEKKSNYYKKLNHQQILQNNLRRE